MNTRRYFFGAATAACFARVATAEWTEAEKANVKVVNDFCSAWDSLDASRLIAFFADDCVYRVTETAAPLKGRAAVLDRIKGFLTNTSKVEFKVIETFVKGPVVINERYDTFVHTERTNRFHLTGMFFVRDGKIAEWTDYVIRP
jgi:uncharacterized protein (TIGR02246 family)